MSCEIHSRPLLSYLNSGVSPYDKSHHLHRIQLRFCLSSPSTRGGLIHQATGGLCFCSSSIRSPCPLNYVFCPGHRFHWRYVNPKLRLGIGSSSLCVSSNSSIEGQIAVFYLPSLHVEFCLTYARPQQGSCWDHISSPPNDYIHCGRYAPLDRHFSRSQQSVDGIRTTDRL